jgi:phage-related protein
MKNFINQLYVEFEMRSLNEQVILSDLSKDMYEDVIVFYNKNDEEKAKNVTLALASWISKDVNYFLRISPEKMRMYEYDLVASLQLLGQLISISEDFKQWDTAYTLQREYAKLNIKYSLTQAA